MQYGQEREFNYAKFAQAPAGLPLELMEIGTRQYGQERECNDAKFAW
ncbi:MAG: hypothetical protein NPIRA05_19540 [Nitrospirales bacterium]|nr:MAG: hypothetical protein NPIRA05_19540 [Nitrospirales bacterium]